MYIYYNDKLTEKAVLQADSPGFQFGYGVFETILVSRGWPIFVDLHHQRLMKGCAQLGLQLDFKLEDVIKHALQLSEKLNIPEGRLKIICFRDVDRDSTIMTLSEFKQDDTNRTKGFALTISSIKRNPHSPLCYLKSLNYSENILARNAAKQRGYDEALFLNVNERLCEGTVSNIFWTKGRSIFTPGITSGILEGTTRRQVMDICGRLKLKIVEGSFELAELISAEEVFVTNSLMGIMPVGLVDNTTYNISEYKITKQIQDEYKMLIENHISAKKYESNI